MTFTGAGESRAPAMLRGVGVTFNVIACVTIYGGVPESVACTTKLYAPSCVAVPNTPPFALRVRPGGKLPERMLQVTGKLPPMEENELEYERLMYAGFRFATICNCCAMLRSP